MIYDGGADDWSPEDIQSVLEPVTEVSRTLVTAGHDVEQVAVLPDLAWFHAIRGADLIFNLCEGIGGISHLEYKVASAIELAGKPYTGCSAWTMTVCHRKPLLNAVLQAAGLPIPGWYVPHDQSVPETFPLPAIVKPAEEDASVGIEQASVVTTRAELEERVASMAQSYGGIMVQEYIHGRELGAAFVGDHTLPLSEIDFGGMPDGAWPIVSFDAKWKPGCNEYVGTLPVCPAKVSAPLEESLLRVARVAWRTVHGRGYGRVDMRVATDGQPWVLEVNPSPDISSDAGLVNMARAFGWSYDDLVSRIVDAALAHAAVRAAPQIPVLSDDGQALRSGEHQLA